MLWSTPTNAAKPTAPATARSLLTRPLVKQTIEEFTKKYKEKVTERDAERREERKELSHREWVHQLSRVKTHPLRGDEAIVKLLKMGFRSTGEIQPVKHKIVGNLPTAI
jgi:hypothetical protein